LKATLGAVLIITLALGARAFWLEPASLVLKEERLVVPWPAGRQLRLAVIADLHVGAPFNGLGKLHEVVKRTNAAQPDMVCLLGDFMVMDVIGRRFIPPEKLTIELAGLHAPAGVFAVLGNHDNWFDHDRVRRALERAAVRVVEDTALLIDTPAGPVWVAGVSDVWTGQPNVRTALANIGQDSAPVLLLTHNPDIFPEVPNRVSLTLAGHTHGGQVRLPFIGRPIVPSRYGQRYAAGHVVEGGRHLYVTTGIGMSSLPVRFGVPPTVIVLTLTSR
jgi:uncharacterized protein